MIDHVSLNVRDYQKSKDFYVAALAPLGYELLHEFQGKAAGFGRDGEQQDFWIREASPQGTVHIAFAAADREAVEVFYAAAISAGGRDNGPPGLRTVYHPDYYGAYVFDPDDNNVEAVHHG
jgi:catechol 2,3-dioxygenase-like lactoylglutathione lyase family enzyme